MANPGPVTKPIGKPSIAQAAKKRDTEAAGQLPALTEAPAASATAATSAPAATEKKPTAAPTQKPLPVRHKDRTDGFVWSEGTEHQRVPLKAIPKDNRKKGQVFKGLQLGTDKACKGLYKVVGAGCSHGPDALLPGKRMDREVAPLTTTQAASATAAAAVPCIGNGTDGLRVKVLYVYAGTNRYTQYKSSFEAWAAGMDSIYNRSAAKTGGVRHIRFEQDPSSCVPTITPVQVSSGAMNDFSSMISELKNRGYNRTDRKYTVFGDANVYCGIGEFAGDTRKTSSNYSNFGPDFARTDANCWGPDVIAHELGHNLGAVNNNAPNTSGGAHCTDEWDVMCYSDSPYYPQMRTVCTASGADSLLDCREDDYYNSNPPAGSYLSNYWNMADSTFLVKNGGGGTTTTTSPTTSTTTTTSPTPTPTGCTALGYSASGSLSRGYYTIVPNGQYYYSSYSGLHSSCLTGPSGADFDMYLQKWNGSSWVTIGSSTKSGSNEQISVSSGAGYFRLYIYAYAGSGSYTVKYDGP